MQEYDFRMSGKDACAFFVLVRSSIDEACHRKCLINARPHQRPVPSPWASLAGPSAADRCLV